jgi:ubiquinone/menaquinone biosynthesis C-methylase UbiE
MTEPIQRMKRAALGAAAVVVLVAAGLSWSCASTAASLSSGKDQRKPAEVMSWRGARWLERDTREQEERPDILLELMGLSRGDIVADVGCGTGFYARRMAKRVAPEGRVYGVDVQPEMLEFLQELAAQESISNITPILGDPNDPNLPDGTVDWILLVDVYHEFQDPESMLAQLRKALAPEGRIALVEYRLEGGTARHIRRDHRMSPEQVMNEWIPAGFELIEQNESLPSQDVFIFGKAELPVSILAPESAITIFQ